MSLRQGIATPCRRGQATRYSGNRSNFQRACSPAATHGVRGSTEVDEIARGVLERGYAVVDQHVKKSEAENLLHHARSLAREIEPAPPLGTPAARERFLESSQGIDTFTDPAFEGTEVDDPGDCLEKMGHALHELDDVFSRFSRTESIKRILQAMGMEQPAPVQSLVLFKQPGGGSEVKVHQDATFLLSDPSSVIALWWPLEDATTENGCLWIEPGSHRKDLTQRMRREGNEVVFEGSPPDVDEGNLVPVEVEVGSMVIMHGHVVHMSTKNESDRSRHAYTVHYVDLSCEWRRDNWLQRDERLPLTAL